MTSRRLSPATGFTLIELMVALTVVALLAAIAIPNYSAYVQRGKRAAAKAILLESAGRLERNYTTHGCYGQTTAAACQAGSGAPIVAAGTAFALAPADGRAQYRIDLTAGGAQTFTLTATPCGAAGANCPAGSESNTDAECGALTLANTGERGVGDGASGTLAHCWQR
ncbi:MAG: type IV pilin protein [Burkholderiaceae bacterium]